MPCDCYAALKDATKGGSVIFCKNSDRPVDEAQIIRVVRGQKHDEDKVKCTYIEIPQVRETYEVILSSPWWIWGAEIGVNELGVAIGNEAQWSKEIERRGNEELIGMDLVRLGLERGKNAYEAMHVIIDLLEEFGQGGSCEYNGSLYYDNSFLIADPEEVWILETAGRYWIAKKYSRGVVSISNVYTVERDWDEVHPKLIFNAIEKGWCKSYEDFNFARDYSDFEEALSPMGCQLRKNRSSYLLNDKKGDIDVEYMMRISRDHYEKSFIAPRWGESESVITSICLHANKELPFQTSSSMVVKLNKFLPSIWITGTSNPCISIFKPYTFLNGFNLPENYSKGKNKYSENSVWWEHEKSKRLANKLNPKFIFPMMRCFMTNEEKRSLEELKKLERRALDLIKKGEREKVDGILEPFIRKSWERSIEKTKELKKFLESLRTTVPRSPHIYSEFWDEQNLKHKLKL